MKQKSSKDNNGTILTPVMAQDIACHLHSYTNPVLHTQLGPKIIERGQGIYVYDQDGRGYLEGVSGLWSAALGFSNQRLVQAALNQMQQLPFYHSFNHRVTPVVAQLAAELIKISPVPMSKAFFTSSGSEANDTAIKMVWYYHNALGYPKKKKIISRFRAYHGVTIATASLTGRAHNHTDFDLPLAGILHTDCPHFYRPAVPYQREQDFAVRCAMNLEQLIIKEGPETIAAMIVEPVMAAGGVVVPPKNYFDLIQPILKKYHILLIADEVVCGFWRTGQMFACQLYGIQPDIITLAKALTSAYMPMGALLINQQMYQVIANNANKIGTFAHGFTYSGHPVCAAVALECLKIYQENNFIAHLQQITPVFQSRMQQLKNHPLVGEVRGVGLLGGVELVADKISRKPFATNQNVGREALKFMLKTGLILRNYGDTITCCPPLIASTPEIEHMFDLLTQGLDETQKWLQNC